MSEVIDMNFGILKWRPNHTTSKRQLYNIQLSILYIQSDEIRILNPLIKKYNEHGRLKIQMSVLFKNVNYLFALSYSSKFDTGLRLRLGDMVCTCLPCWK